MKYVYAKMSRCGLCNKLCTWAQAELCAKHLGGRMIAPDFEQLPSVWALIRGEHELRTNRGDFEIPKDNYVTGFRKLRVLAVERHRVITFSGLGHGTFEKVLEDHDYIVQRLWNMTSAGVRARVAADSADPYIGVHIRRGDFRVAGFALADEWYVRAIKEAHGIATSCTCVRVFSDENASRLDFLKRALPDLRVIVQTCSTPLTDLWLLSRSQAMVGTSGSSFSIWATIIGQMPSVWHPNKAPRSDELYVDSVADDVRRVVMM